MKAMLLRVGIDKSSDGLLAPIFPDGSFEYIPLSENRDSSENRTYNDIIGRKGKLLSTYLPPEVAVRRVHMDPEFITFTYGDEGRKANYLKKLNPGDILAFYAGLTQFNGDEWDEYYEGDEYSEALYIIGYFTVRKVIDLSKLVEKEVIIRTILKKFPHNSHPKRHDTGEMVLVVGDPDKSKLLDRAILLSQKKPNKIGRRYHAVSPKMEELLGIEGSIQRSIPPRFITEEDKIKNLKNLLIL